MTSSRVRRRTLRRLASVLAAAALLALVPLAAGALADSPSKPYTANVAPQSGLPAGAFFATLSLTLHNEADEQAIGSANWTLPAAFSDFSESLPFATLAGNVLQLRDIGIDQHESLTVSVGATLPCLAGDYASTVVAKQSNDFNGTGNDFTIVGPSNLVFHVAGACSLTFAFPGAQPASAQKDEDITTAIYDPTGPPLKAALLDANDALASTVETTVDLGIGANPGGGTLTAASASTVGGIATFASARIDASGLGYTLVASSTDPGINAGESDPFDIVDVGKICGAGTCTGQATGQQVTGTYSIVAPSSAGDLLTLAVSVDTLDCADYTEHTDVVSFDFTGSTTKLVTLRFQNVNRERTSSFRVCFSSPTFTTGLLPRCKTATQAPCVVSVKSDHGFIVIVFRAPAGDPKGRG